ncbi:MAG: septum formation initiator family protein [Candidatus Roizmanbacteria bacterium]|nr:septum formation initiator family protein [Candidatus Roizmanbacteria bacterium]
MKRLASWLFIIISILLSVNLARSIYDLQKRESVIHEARERLAKAQEEHNKLKEELDYVRSPAYVEQQAREKLNLARPGEVVLIVPEVTPPPDESESEEQLEIWQQWLDLFRFGV